jgi:hypothetical protein
MRRGVTFLTVLVVLLAIAAAAALGAGTKRAFPGPGFKSCGSFGRPAIRIHVYAKHVRCSKALRINHAYEAGTEVTERGWDELCLDRFPGWCCGGGGGAVTCKRGHSTVLSVSA